jgi:hypothetical protein
VFDIRSAMGGERAHAGTLGPRAEEGAVSFMLLFAFTVIVSAGLMFLVEPMVARMVLPRAGGGPMVWNTCVVFFQLMLLAGYWYARFLTAKADRRRLAVHGLVLLAPIAFLPLSIGGGAPAPGANPTPWLLVALSGAVGLPFFVLATTTSLFQRWFADTKSPWARNPYVLYACSNLGSVLALLAYPILVEPRLTLTDQARWWSVGYGVFVVLALTAMAAVWRQVGTRETSDSGSDADGGPASHASWAQRVRWTLLAFAPSSLMLGVTSYLATDVASVPLLWVAPLALYLITFVLAFSSWGDEIRAYAAGALPLFVLTLVLLLMARVTLPLDLTFILHLLVFTVASFSCHWELASDRPPARGLTDFYLWVAVGGVAGGLFNSLLAPLVFSSIAEYPIALTLASALFRPWRRREPLRLSARDAATAATIGAFSTGYLLLVPGAETRPVLVVTGLGVAAFATFTQSGRPVRFALCVGAMLAAGEFVHGVRTHALYRERTYFGVYRVETDQTGAYHELLHGTTLHGRQAIDPARRSEPLTYYARTGPFGVAFAGLPNVTPTSRVAVVGLGVGTLGAYAHADQQWTFYEIDPAVERIAGTGAYFTYLKDCEPRCTVVIGDARQSLAQGDGTVYDLIVLDAFSSDAIPLHLLTRDALRIYLSRLSRGGVLAFHTSNRHLTLAPVLAKLALSEHLIGRDWLDAGPDSSANGKEPAEWMLMARSDADLGPIASDARWNRVTAPPSTPLWTDDFTNIWSVLRRR